jgi:hypothetical protein
MSTLMVALASLGGVVLAGVVAHGAWQARRAGPKRATPVLREEPTAEGPARDAGPGSATSCPPATTPSRSSPSHGACRSGCRCSSTP